LLIVLDANVATKWFAPEKWEAEAKALFARFQAGEIQICAPDLIRPELANALRHHMYEGNLSRMRALECWAEFLALPIITVPMAELTPMAVALAFQHNGGVMDAHYVSLAIQRGCKLLTADERLMNAFASLDRCVHIGTF
jgi:predicted nucleic acid-binding protein